MNGPEGFHILSEPPLIPQPNRLRPTRTRDRYKGRTVNRPCPVDSVRWFYYLVHRVFESPLGHLVPDWYQNLASTTKCTRYSPPAVGAPPIEVIARFVPILLKVTPVTSARVEPLKYAIAPDAPLFGEYAVTVGVARFDTMYGTLKLVVYVADTGVVTVSWPTCVTVPSAVPMS